MANPRARPQRYARPLALVVLALAFVLLPARRAAAGKNDLQLLNLCRPLATTQECEWVKRDANGTMPIKVDTAGQARFRSLMSELGVVLAPRLATPADTLGFAGFQFSGELGLTQISASRDYWTASRR